MIIKSGVRSPTDSISYAVGYVQEIDVNGMALIRLSTGKTQRVRTDLLQGKSALPQAGETWILDQSYGQWMFAVLMNPAVDSHWIAPTLTSPWTALGSPAPLVGYRKQIGGEVWLRGALTTGTAPSDAFTLPATYRPSGTLSFTCAGGVLSVAANGLVRVESGTAPISLDGVRFLAEN